MGLTVHVITIARPLYAIIQNYFTVYSVDATKDNGRMGRLLNHSRKNANVVTKVIEVDSYPYLCLIAVRDIDKGEELVYDYGERREDVVKAMPWLAS